MIARNARARWEGGLRDGKGTFSSGSGLFSGPYSFASRFESGEGTNPEELIGAALASCFSMALAGRIAKDRYQPGWIETKARVSMDRAADGGFSITKIELETEGDVPGMEQGSFERLADEAKRTCPVSRALGATEIVLVAARLSTPFGATGT